MSSTISPARQALHANLLMAFTSTAVQVRFGNPKDFEQQQAVGILGTGPASEDFALLGPNQPDDEKYAIALRIKVHEPSSNDGAATDAAAWAVYDTIRAAVRSDPTFGGVLIMPARTSAARSDGPFQPEDASGWAVFIDFTVDCFGRAT